MAVFKVAEVQNAAFQCMTICACGGNFEHYIFCKLMIVFKIGNVQ